MKYIAGAGTRDWTSPPWPPQADWRWCQLRSRFTQKMAVHGLELHAPWSVFGMDVPPWSCELSGTFFAGKDLRAWWRGAASLVAALLELPPEDRNMLLHSHCGNAGILAAFLIEANGETVRSLTTVCTPRRRELDQYSTALKCRRRQITTKEIIGNHMQWMGGRFSSWSMPDGWDNYVAKRKIGHS